MKTKIVLWVKNESEWKDRKREWEKCVSNPLCSMNEFMYEKENLNALSTTTKISVFNIAAACRCLIRIWQKDIYILLLTSVKRFVECLQHTLNFFEPAFLSHSLTMFFLLLLISMLMSIESNPLSMICK